MPEAARWEARSIPIKSELDIVAARVEGRNLAKEMGFGIIDQARIATVISELARNLILYAKDGQIILSRIELGGRVGFQIICEDRGPGIEDINRVMRSDHSTIPVPAHWTGQGLGTGLPGTKRLVDEFEIRSQVGVGTTVTVCKWLA